MHLPELSLTPSEYIMAESATLAAISSEVFDFLREQGKHVILFGAHAVNVYATPPRMTSDVDVMTDLDAGSVAEDIRARLARKFHIAVRVRKVKEEGYRVYQIQKDGNRHLVDVRAVTTDVHYRPVSGLNVIEVEDLVAMKVIAVSARGNKPKGLTDRADLERLLVAHPKLRLDDRVQEALTRFGREDLLAAWKEIADNPMEQDDEDD